MGCFLGFLGVSWEPLGSFLEPLVSPSLPQRTSRNFPLLNLHSFLNFTSCFFSFFAPSWLAFRLHFGSLLGPIFAQLRPKLPLDILLVRKLEFSKKRAPPLARARFWRSEWPKIGSRCPQDRSKTVFESDSFSSLFLSSISVGLESIFDSILGPLLEPKFRAAAGLVDLKTTKVDLWAPKMLQEPPNRHPRPPKSAKEPAKMTQDPLKTTQDARKMPPNDPKLPQDASKTPFSPCLSSFLFLSLSLSLCLSLSLSLAFSSPFSLFSLLSLIFSSCPLLPNCGGELYLLGASWGALGGVLGASWAVFKAIQKNTKITCKKRANKGGYRPSFWALQRKSKSSQNGTPNATKIETLFKSEKVALQEPLAAVLG